MCIPGVSEIFAVTKANGHFDDVNKTQRRIWKIYSSYDLGTILLEVRRGKYRMLRSLFRKLPLIRRIIQERDYLRSIVFDAGGNYEVELAASVAQGRHRESVGGLWEEMGQLQFQFLVDHGLKPTHRLLALGCGSLRGGLRFIPYVNPGNYWGIDNNEALIEAGWNTELSQANLQNRQPRSQLVCLKDFEFISLKNTFDFVLAQSVFTHLNFNRIRRCLTRLAPVMVPGGKFFATFLEANTERDLEEPLRCKPDGLISYSHRDPFHYYFEDFQHAISRLPWTVYNHGEWGHPAKTRMLVFEAVPQKQ